VRGEWVELTKLVAVVLLVLLAVAEVLALRLVAG
jgi:hypothetical protein